MDPATTAFVYGTLQLPEVLTRVLGRVPAMAAARLHDHRRGRLSGERYPAVVEAPQHHVDGRLLLGLSPAEWSTLDAYEGDLYERRLATVTSSSNQVGEAQTYVLAGPARQRFEPVEWSLPEFVERHLADFLRELDA